MVRIKFKLTERVYDLIKIDDTRIIVQFYASRDNIPRWTTDSVASVLRNIKDGTMIVLEGDVSKW
jgi:hypothetical protein